MIGLGPRDAYIKRSSASGTGYTDTNYGMASQQPLGEFSRHNLKLPIDLYFIVQG